MSGADPGDVRRSIGVSREKFALGFDRYPAFFSVLVQAPDPYHHAFIDLPPTRYLDNRPRSKREKAFDLRLMSPLEDVGDIPAEGRNLIVLATVQDVLHFRILDADGRRVEDTNETQLPDKAPQIAELKDQIGELWGITQISWSDKERTVNTVRSIIGHAEEDPSVLSFRGHVTDMVPDGSPAWTAYYFFEGEEALDYFLGLAEPAARSFVKLLPEILGRIPSDDGSEGEGDWSFKDLARISDQLIDRYPAVLWLLARWVEILSQPADRPPGYPASGPPTGIES